MNKKSKILAGAFAAVAVCTVPFAMVGCNADASEVGAVMSKAATNYYERHVDYDNFKNTTYTLAASYSENYKSEVTYLKKKGDTTPVTKTFENYYKGTMKEVFSIRKDGDNLSLYVYIKEGGSGYGYGTDEDGLLKKYNESGTYETTYVMNQHDGGYYITKTEVRKEDGEETYTSSQYYQFENQAAYQEVFEGYITNLNKLVLTGSYFQLSQDEETATMYSSRIKYSKEFNTYKVSATMSSPYINYNAETGELESESYTTSFEGTFNGNELGTCTMTMKFKDTNVTGKQKISLNIKNSAKSASNFKISLDGKTSTSSQINLYVPTDLNSGLGF